MSSSPHFDPHPFAADAGVSELPEKVADPLQALDELMVVIEALCPQWPERAPFDGTEKMLL